MTETFDTRRALISLNGEDVVHFLQGLLTSDVSKLNEDKIQFAALLSPQGKILHDMFLVAEDNTILLDIPAAQKDPLLKRLAMYKLRAKVTIAETSRQVSYGHGLADPRHPELPSRNYSAAPGMLSSTDYDAITLRLGIPDSIRDFAPDEVVPLDAGYDLLHAISFSKGCYVGQEVTARMHYKNIARKGFFILKEAGIPARLALLKFEDYAHCAGVITVDNISYHATLPGWMIPKFQQFQEAAKKQ